MLRTTRRGMRVFVDACETHGVAAVLVKEARMLSTGGNVHNATRKYDSAQGAS